MNVIQKIIQFTFYFLLFAGCDNSTIGHEKINEDSTNINLASVENLSDTLTITKGPDYFFEPHVSVLSGKIVTKTFYGHPGYGETPDTDVKELAYIFLPDDSINVSHKEINEKEINYINTKAYNFTKVQLTSTSGIIISDYENKHVRLTGTFFDSHTGHHHTDVLLDVQKIEKL